MARPAHTAAEASPKPTWAVAAATLFLLLGVFLPASPVLAGSIADLAACWNTQVDDSELPHLFGTRRGAVPAGPVLEKRGAVIGDVVVRTLDVFDPSLPCEENWVFNAANLLHPTTQEKVIRRRLLFAEGDPYDQEILAESERLLRSLGFFYDVWVLPVGYERNRVEILVVTRDVWTLGVGAGFTREGGDNTLQFSVRDSNFLGTGRLLEAKYTDDAERSSYRLRYHDTGLLGSRVQLRVKLEDRDDGHRRTLDLERPFYALDSRWAAGTSWFSDLKETRLYSEGLQVHRFEQETSLFEIRGGLSRGGVEGRAVRWTAGYTYREDRFAPLRRWRPNPIPEDRVVSYPWIEVERVRNDFVTLRNMDRIARSEDFNLGMKFHARLGVSTESLGAYKDQLIFSTALQSGRSFKDRDLLLFSGYAFGRYGQGEKENVQLGGRVRYFRRNLGRHQLHARLEFDAGWNLDLDRQILLGGDSGLRGYPSKFQDGDRRLQFTLEQRFYTNWEIFRLVHVGAAVFADAGRAWFDDQSEEDSPILLDVGVGLRLGSSRSASGAMLHLDVAYPLNGDHGGIQWLVHTRETF